MKNKIELFNDLAEVNGVRPQCNGFKLFGRFCENNSYDIFKFKFENKI